MRQVPHYGIIGNGRVARHFCHYLQLLQLPYRQWQRQQSITELHKLIAWSDRLLLLISDDAIEPFIEQYPQLHEKRLLHFAASLYSPMAIGVHPLMTFTDELYPLELYQQIVFIRQQEEFDLSDLLPGLTNDCFVIPAQDAELYHSLCVLSGNFSCMLWQKLFSELNSRWGIPKQAALPYLQQVFANIATQAQPLTGPLVRNDQRTLQRNYAALTADPFQAVYQAFINAYQQEHTQ